MLVQVQSTAKCIISPVTKYLGNRVIFFIINKYLLDLNWKSGCEYMEQQNGRDAVLGLEEGVLCFFRL